MQVATTLYLPKINSIVSYVIFCSRIKIVLCTFNRWDNPLVLRPKYPDIYVIMKQSYMRKYKTVNVWNFIKAVF